MILIAGDSHSLSNLQKTLKDIPENSTCIHVGDIGLGFTHYRKEENFLDIINARLVKKNSFFYGVRGNHDDPKTFRPDHPHNLKYTNIKFLSDYTYLDIECKTILCVGGALSIDRCFRRPNVDYWRDEVFVYDESKMLDIAVDVLITHCPGEEFEPWGIDLFVLNLINEEKKRNPFSNLLEELKEERRNIQKLVDKVKPKRYYYGHMHKHYMGEYKGIFYRCLTENELCAIPDII